MAIRRVLGWVCFVALVASVPVHAAVVYTTRPWITNSSACVGLSGANRMGVAVQTPVGSTYSVTSVTAEVQDLVGGTSFTMDFYSDAGGGIWDTIITTIGTQTGGALDSKLEYTFTPAAPIALAPDTVYWFVLRSPNADECAVGWSYGQTVPTGVFTRVAEVQFYNASARDLTGYNFTLEVNAELVVPVVPSMPQWALIILAMLLMLGAGWALRRRSSHTLAA